MNFVHFLARPEQAEHAAHMWFELATPQGIGNAVKGRDIVVKLMTPDQIAKAKRLAQNGSRRRNG